MSLHFSILPIFPPFIPKPIIQSLNKNLNKALKFETHNKGCCIDNCVLMLGSSVGEWQRRLLAVLGLDGLITASQRFDVLNFPTPNC